MHEFQIFAALGGLALVGGGALIAFVMYRSRPAPGPKVKRVPANPRVSPSASERAAAPASKPSRTPEKIAVKQPLTRVSFLGAERYMGAGEETEDRTSWGPGVMCRIREALVARGLVTGSVVVEDHGCAMAVRSGVDRLMLRCGFRDDAWIVIACDASSGRDVSAESPLLARVRHHVDELLRGLEGVEGIIWLTADEAYAEDAPTRVTPPPTKAVARRTPVAPSPESFVSPAPPSVRVNETDARKEVTVRARTKSPAPRSSAQAPVASASQAPRSSPSMLASASSVVRGNTPSGGRAATRAPATYAASEGITDEGDDLLGSWAEGLDSLLTDPATDNSEPAISAQRAARPVHPSSAQLMPPPPPRAAPIKLRRDPRLPPPLPGVPAPSTPPPAARISTPGVALLDGAPVRRTRTSSNESSTASIRPSR